MRYSTGIISAGVAALKKWDPQRYGNLNIVDDGQSYDIFSQAAQALRQPNSPVLGGLQVQQIIGTGVSLGVTRANPVNFPFAPSKGQNPPPNSGTNFVPAINPAISNPPPKVSLIVKKNGAGRWMDDNNGDWTEWKREGASGRDGH